MTSPKLSLPPPRGERKYRINSLPDQTRRRRQIDALRDERLSLTAKGLLALLMTFPQRDPVSPSRLLSMSRESRKSTDSAIRELDQHGYIARRDARDMFGSPTEPHYVAVVGREEGEQQ